jgi:hypothetical protein
MTTTTPTMTSRTTTITEQELLALERDYWDALKDREARTAGRMTAGDSTIVGASGVSGVDPHTTRIAQLCDDAVAIMYGVHEDLEVDGKPVKLDAFDTSVWSKSDIGWTCVLHTESIAGDAFGRDRTAGKSAG